MHLPMFPGLNPGHNRVKETFTRQMALCEGMSVVCCYATVIFL